MSTGIENLNKLRQKQAAQLGLPNNATWAEIDHAADEASRKKQALQYGLPENASWAEVGTTELWAQVDKRMAKRP
ncbi:MAG TPA: hypothetical protein VMR46_02280 [Candidatus Paceibacterota bacterium]|jgi:hypothetical protein|nr:hypothetical protein [Candidatus Paceibacterota bacterium]